MRKTRAPTTSRTRTAENASWLTDTLVKPPRTRSTSESPSAPTISRACLPSCPLTHMPSLSLIACDISSVLPSSSPVSASNDRTTLDASMKNMTARNWRSRTAVSGFGAIVRSIPTFPATSKTSNVTEARVASACLSANVPANPTTTMTSIISNPSPRKTREGTVRMIHGARNR